MNADTSIGKESINVVAALAGDFKKVAERLSKQMKDSDEESSNNLASKIRDGAFLLPDGFVMTGGVQLLSAMLYAYPDRSSGSIRKRLWGRAALSMHRALGELDLWAELARDDTGRHTLLFDFLAQSVDALLRRMGWSHGWLGSQRRSAALAIASIILSEDPELSNRETFEYRLEYILRGHPLAYPYNHGFSRAEGQQDRFEPMFFWPLPPYVVRSFPELKNLGQLLSRYVASPIDFADTGPAVLQLVAFGAAFLGSRIDDRLIDNWQNRAAVAWLGRSIPKWIFSMSVEEIIRDVGRLHEPATASA
jgi:hypothetical protein